MYSQQRAVNGIGPRKAPQPTSAVQRTRRQGIASSAKMKLTAYTWHLPTMARSPIYPALSQPHFCLRLRLACALGRFSALRPNSLLARLHIFHAQKTIANATSLFRSERWKSSANFLCLRSGLLASTCPMKAEIAFSERQSRELALMTSRSTTLAMKQLPD